MRFFSQREKLLRRDERKPLDCVLVRKGGVERKTWNSWERLFFTEAREFHKKPRCRGETEWHLETLLNETPQSPLAWGFSFAFERSVPVKGANRPFSNFET